MIGSIAFVLLGAAAAATPCENLATLKISDATITSAVVVPEGPPPARGGGGGGAGGGGAEVAELAAEAPEASASGCGCSAANQPVGAGAPGADSRPTRRARRWRSARRWRTGSTSSEYPGSLPRSAGSEAFFRLPY